MKFDGKFKSLAELRGYSTIDLTSKSIQDIQDYVDSKKDVLVDSFNFPIKEGVLILREDMMDNIELPSFMFSGTCKNYIYFKVDDTGEFPKFHIEATMNVDAIGTTVGLCAANIDISKYKPAVKPLVYTEETKNPVIGTMLDEYRQKVAKSLSTRLSCLALFSLMYISLIQMDRETVYKEAGGMKYKVDPNKKKIASRTKKVQVINDDKVVYVFTASTTNIKSFISYMRHTESWGVAGHYRFYASGLIRWIDSFVKGKGKKEAGRYKVK
jgi:hypothetical protein